MLQDILLVEDNPDDLELTMDAFRTMEIAERVKACHDGVEAVEYLLSDTTRAKPRVSLVIMDLNMPRLNGLQVLQKMRADPRTRTIPVVMLTSSGREEDRMESYGLGVNSYVRKPVDFEDFIRVARELKIYWTEINEPPPDC